MVVKVVLLNSKMISDEVIAISKRVINIHLVVYYDNSVGINSNAQFGDYAIFNDFIFSEYELLIFSHVCSCFIQLLTSAFSCDGLDCGLRSERRLQFLHDIDR